MKKDKKIELSNVLFWDVNPESIDYEKHITFIIERVLTMGTLEDFSSIQKYYGKLKIKNVVKTLRYLDNRTLNFCSFYYNIPLNEFRCYEQKQLNITHWNY